MIVVGNVPSYEEGLKDTKRRIEKDDYHRRVRKTGAWIFDTFGEEAAKDYFRREAQIYSDTFSTREEYIDPRLIYEDRSKMTPKEFERLRKEALKKYDKRRNRVRTHILSSNSPVSNNNERDRK